MTRQLVLIVEDERDIRDLMVHSVRRAGAVAHPVESGEAALAYLADHGVALVVLDIALPGMDGWEVLRAIRAHPDHAEVPVLVVSVLDGARPSR